MNGIKMEQLKCPCCGSFKAMDAIFKMANHIGSTINMPFNVTSAYRCPAHNKAVGGAPNSSHLKGLALDIDITGISKDKLYKFIEEAVKLRLRIGIYKNHIHIDSNDIGPRLFWIG
jgi:uncharacterized protein YcbK (DUF882 family)